jgi:hypothetical protein
MFTLDANAIHSWQSCKRKWLLERDWFLARFRPKQLFDSCLRRGVVQLSQQADSARVAIDARTRFLELAADPGLDMVGDPYRAAKDWCAMLDVALRYLGTTPIPVLHDPQPRPLSPFVSWKFGSWADDSGALHRWLTVDRLDADALARELHSWRTIGDVAVARVPMTLHVVELGPSRNGRHSSAWARAYKHPGLASLRIRFNKPEETAWKPFWFADQREYGVEEWLEIGQKQRAFEKLVREVPVACPTDAACLDVQAQVMLEAAEMRRLLGNGTEYQHLPMSRPACDTWYPCSYQEVCYSPAPQLVDIDSVGLYVRRKSSTVSVKEAQPV